MESIGRYRLSQRIGAGSFATVYKGRDEELDVTVAIKVLAENWAANADVRQRFLAEARLLRRIHDERIVRVHDVGTTDDDRPYFVMDYADGGSLEQLRRQLVPPGRALRLCAEAARGLEVLHRHHLIHRDVTPGNILLSHSAAGVRVVLADLGVAKSMVERSAGTMTAGTPAYMALEQAQGAELDQRVDVYSMAAVAYALLSGHPPFPLKTLSDLLMRDWSVGVTPIADRLGAPPLLDALMAASLSPIREHRPATALELSMAFDQLADVLPGGETYVPRPLDPGGEVTSPVAPSWQEGLPAEAYQPVAPMPDRLRPIAPTPSGYPSIGTPSSLGSYRSLTSAPQYSSVTPTSETPQDMLDHYLGKGKYAPKPVKESHSVGFWVGAVAVGVIVFALVLFLTINYLI